MSDALAEPKPWPRRRWWWLVAAIFAGQLGLVFWLGQRQFPPPRPPAAAPVLQLGTLASTELLALTDPTLLALPHPQGFSGPLWLNPPPAPYQPYVWSAPPGWLALDEQQLGSLFRQFVATNQFTSWEPSLRPTPERLQPPLLAAEAETQRSTVCVAGALAGRQLLTPLALPSWTNSDVLKCTRVQLLVGADGRPISTTLGLLSDRSGSSEADLHALAEARKARFSPLNLPPEAANQPLAGLAWGELIFQWHTLPQPDTNELAD